jgi:dimethylargininase
MVRFDSSWAPLHSVLLHRPVEPLSDADAEAWGYPAGRDAARCDTEFAGFAALLAAEGVDVHPDERPTGVDAVYACDPLIPTPFGPIVGRMRKPLRQPENRAAAAHLARLGVTPFGRLDRGHVEGGDVVWLDATSAIIGIGTRSDHAGADALEALIAPRGATLRRIELPWRDGPDVCLHMRSLLNIVDANLAVVLRPWMPTAALQWLEQRGLRLLDAVAEEYDTQGNNLLVLRPGVVAMVAGNPRSVAMLNAAGVEVHTFAGDELCIKGTGGPTCLCFDLWRAD